MTRAPRIAAASVAAALALGGAAAEADAYVIGGEPWPGPSIAVYTAAPKYKGAARRAIRVWNRKRVGVRFVRVGSRRRADVVVGYLRQRGRFCGGVAQVGYIPGQRTSVRVARGCPSKTARELTAAHELGHVLGLSHENRRCTLMNSVARGFTRTVPGKCRRSRWRYWRRVLVGPDDARGVRALYSGEARFPRAAFTAEQTGFDVRVTDRSTGDVHGRFWNFGDPDSGAANRASGSTATHRYSAPGTYTITLRVTHPSGSSSTATTTVTIP